MSHLVGASLPQRGPLRLLSTKALFGKPELAWRADHCSPNLRLANYLGIGYKIAMAFKKFGPVPYEPLQVIDRDRAVDADWLSDLLRRGGPKTSLLLRRKDGAAKRGGFFFHLVEEDGSVEFRDFGNGPIIKLPLDKAVRLINHVAAVATLAVVERFFEIAFQRLLSHFKWHIYEH